VLDDQGVLYKLEYIDTMTGVVSDSHPYLSGLKDKLEQVRRVTRHSIAAISREACAALRESRRQY